MIKRQTLIFQVIGIYFLFKKKYLHSFHFDIMILKMFHLLFLSKQNFISKREYIAFDKLVIIYFNK